MHRMRKRFVLALAGWLLSAAGAALGQAREPFVVKDIRVEGVQRIEPGTVFSYLPVKVGDKMTEEMAQQALRALYATGFFKDVRLEAENGVLVVLVEERPAVAQIDFSGLSEFQPDALKRVLADLGMAEGRTFDRAVLDLAEQELKRQYLSRGKYAAEVQTTVTPLERNRVAVSFSVVEGDVAKIQSISIVGASAFAEKELLELFSLRTGGWLTWYTKLDQYSRQRLSADLETLRSFYQNQGYLDFNVDTTQVSITPDRKGIYIAVNITEGEKYTVSDVQVAGQTPVPREELQKLVLIKSGDVFSRQRLTESTKAITERLGNDGYAFANANAVPQVDKEKRTVAFTILVDPGRRVYVRRINVLGNTKTRDEVIRREMRQLEGAYYDGSKIQLSRRRIDRTQYFKEVNVETAPVEGQQDQVDVVYSVKEKETGNLMLGVGYSSVDKVVIQASLSQPNAFGNGKSLSFNINSGSVNQVYSVSYFDPYYTIDGVSRGFDVYKRNVDASDLTVGAYTTSTLGGGVRFGYPLSERASISFGVAAENVQLETFDNSPFVYKDFVAQFGNEYSFMPFTLGWAYDTRNSLITTTDGALTRISSEVGVGDIAYYRVSLMQQYFYPLSRTFTLALTGDFGVAGGLQGKPLPFFKNYYAGGAGTVRGYEPLSLGPRDPVGNALGGSRRVVGGVELLFPMPGAEQDKSLRLGAFIDVGQVYGENEKVSLSELRASAGFALMWGSPFGPLKISIAEPLNAVEGVDRIQRLQLSFGTGF
jgi:outer membrane protein insertion porin family